MMISASFDDLEAPVYLLYEHEIGESMWHDETRELKEPYWARSSQYIDIHTIAPSDDEYELLTLMSPFSEYLCEGNSVHRLTSLITEDDSSFEFCDFLDQLLCFFSFDIGDFCMFYRSDGMDFYIFCHTLQILDNCFREVFLAV
jgi:hypothetical protein